MSKHKTAPTAPTAPVETAPTAPTAPVETAPVPAYLAAAAAAADLTDAGRDLIAAAIAAAGAGVDRPLYKLFRDAVASGSMVIKDEATGAIPVRLALTGDTWIARRATDGIVVGRGASAGRAAADVAGHEVSLPRAWARAFDSEDRGPVLAAYSAEAAGTGAGGRGTASRGVKGAAGPSAAVRAAAAFAAAFADAVATAKATDAAADAAATAYVAADKAYRANVAAALASAAAAADPVEAAAAVAAAVAACPVPPVEIAAATAAADDVHAALVAVLRAITAVYSAADIAKYYEIVRPAAAAKADA